MKTRAGLVAAVMVSAVGVARATEDGAAKGALRAPEVRLDLDSVMRRAQPTGPAAAPPSTPPPTPPPSALPSAAPVPAPTAETSSAAPAADGAAGGATPGDEPPRHHYFGRAGSEWITLGAGYAYDLQDDSDFNGHIAWSRFLADEFEFMVELGGWYFDQVGENTAGVNGSMVFRWHFLHDDAFDWTVFTDAGIGLMATLDEVPDGGTSFNFTPRAGVGVTRRVTDDGIRLIVGARYHHISNARILGDGHNPSRDAVMVYAGVIFPF